MQLGAPINSPFGVLTAIVAPAILTNACSVLALGTSNRVARVVDRTRAVTAELANYEPKSDLYKLLDHELTLLQHRGRLLVSALRLAYGALGGFAASALIAVIGGTLSQFASSMTYTKIAAIAGLAIGLCAVMGLAIACGLMVRETTIAIDNLAQEAAIYSRVVRSRDPIKHP